MKRIAQHFKKKRAAKRMELGKVMRLVDLPTGENPSVTFEMVSKEYKLRWYKWRLFSFAQNLGAKVKFCNENQRVTFHCKDFMDAIFVGSCIDRDTRERVFHQFLKGKSRN